MRNGMSALVAGGAIAVAGLLAMPASAQSAIVEATYVVMGGDGPVARAVLTDATQCPSITLGSAPQPMSARPVPAALATDFPVLVCETPIPAGTTSASIAGQQLPLPGPKLRTIAGIGDTGCRLKDGKDSVAVAAGAKHSQADHDDDSGKFQDCDQPKQWPFAKLAQSLAQAKPDLVVHVGDYIYREAACPHGDKGCAGSPSGDNWMTWQADFFIPAAPLLKAAPWIAIRGNHEICQRAGQGYLIFLDTRPAVNGSLPPCADIFPTYSVTVGGQPFVVIDSSNADDLCPPSDCNSKDYEAIFKGVLPVASSWLVTHKPIWAIRKGPKIVTAALQGALPGGKLPAWISLTLAGHIHLWETLSFEDKRPPQFVLGNGGTLLAGNVKDALPGMKIGGTTIKYGKIDDNWGYTLFTPEGEAWKATYYSPKGNRKFDCRIDRGEVNC